jgi:hypothetical protein
VKNHKSSYTANIIDRRDVTRKTKELDQEKLVSVILGPLSERHWLYLYMEIVTRRTRPRTNKSY